MVKFNNPVKLLITVSLLLMIYTLNVQAANLTKNQRAMVNNTLELKTPQAVLEAFCTPKNKKEAIKLRIKTIIEPLVLPIEKKNNIIITSREMLANVTSVAIQKLLTSPDHLIKISTGSKVTRAKIALESGSNTFSAWPKWEKRKLQAPIITVTIYYDNGVKPTVIISKGI